MYDIPRSRSSTSYGSLGSQPLNITPRIVFGLCAGFTFRMLYRKLLNLNGNRKRLPFS